MRKVDKGGSSYQRGDRPLANINAVVNVLLQSSELGIQPRSDLVARI